MFKEFLVCGLQDVKILLVGSEQPDTIDLMTLVCCVFFLGRIVSVFWYFHLR